VLFNRGSTKHVVGFREGSSLFDGNDFLLQYVDASSCNFKITVPASDSQVGHGLRGKIHSSTGG